MNVLALRADSYGCGYYRISLPASHAGVDVMVRDMATEGIPLDVRDFHGQKILLGVPTEADVVVLQRPLSHHLPAVIEQLQRQGVAVVVEIDDDLSALDSKNLAFSEIHPKGSPHTNWNHLKRCCRQADLVTVTTPALARRYGGHGRVAVLPNCVTEKLLTVETPLDVDFGWTGSLHHHPHDLDVVGATARQLVDEGYTFRVIGPVDGVGKALGLEAVDATGWLDLPFYYRAMGQIRVGMVPLAKTAFNAAKSALKGIEFAALGIPFIASPVPEYVDLQGRGAGLLAHKPNRWYRLLHGLLDHAQERAELATHGRDTVAAYFTIEDNGWRWAEAWERAIQNRQRHGKPRA